jgi:biotin operon repressor
MQKQKQAKIGWEKLDQYHQKLLLTKLKMLLSKGPVSLQELSTEFDRGIGQVKSAIQVLQKQGFNCQVREDAGTAEIARDLKPGGMYHINPALIRGDKYRFGAISDTHLGSKYARLDVLNALYDWFQEEGIKDVFHGGNLIDGECRFNKFDLIPGAIGLTNQCKIAARDYPARKDIITHFICGDDHEGWYAQREGLNIGQVMQDTFFGAKRLDMHYLGYLEADILVSAPKGKTWIRLMHPGGGTAYAISYKPQKIVESFQGGEKPAVLLLGHFHKADLCFPREIFCFQLGCCQDQTPFLRKKNIQAHLGGWIIEITQAPDGHVSRIGSEFMRFYDKGFYQGEKYPRW